MLETIRIRKLGFPIRREFVAFRDRYRLLAPSSAWEKDDRKACSMILDVHCLHVLFCFVLFYLFLFRLTDAMVLHRSRLLGRFVQDDSRPLHSGPHEGLHARRAGT
jgi:hypothetical protein